MGKAWTMEQLIRGQNQRAKQAGARYDLTLEQWRETLEHFDHKCAYCGEREYEVIEHYLPVRIAGTTVSNCVPACASCNALKDSKNHSLSLYQNERVLAFIEGKGVKIMFHIHEYKAIQKERLITLHNAFGTQSLAPWRQGAMKTLIFADLKRKICVFSVHQRPDFESVR